MLVVVGWSECADARSGYGAEGAAGYDRGQHCIVVCVVVVGWSECADARSGYGAEGAAGYDRGRHGRHQEGRGRHGHQSRHTQPRRGPGE